MRRHRDCRRLLLGCRLGDAGLLHDAELTDTRIGTASVATISSRHVRSLTGSPQGTAPTREAAWPTQLTAERGGSEATRTHPRTASSREPDRGSIPQHPEPPAVSVSGTVPRWICQGLPARDPQAHGDFRGEPLVVVAVIGGDFTSLNRSPDPGMQAMVERGPAPCLPFTFGVGHPAGVGVTAGERTY